MLFESPEHPGRAVRLAYCLNLHPAETSEGLLEGLRTITLPLRERLAPGREFGVGMYVSAQLAAQLLAPEGTGEFAKLKAFLLEHGLDPFTWNAFPYGGFGAAGLKQRVYEPTWAELPRLEYSLRTALLALDLSGGVSGGPAAGRHLSVSTHTGWHSSLAPDESTTAQARTLLDTASSDLRGIQEKFGWRVILSLEAEPRSNCNDTSELAAARRELGELAGPEHLGTCLDTCHAAVEFEDPQTSLTNATADGSPLGKIQFTSALALHASRRDHLEPLLALDEPRYLHQVTARAADGGLLRVGDLPELGGALEGPDGEAWWHDTQLRCHFHVPVDLVSVGETGLTTTREHADATLAAALARPERWGTDELHVEIETYTWDVLPREARGPGQLVDGLEREYAHVIARLTEAGWRPA